MNILISNYISEHSTEPRYLSNVFNIIGCKSTLWDHNRVSTFDAFDLTQPDLYITHYSMITQDLITYLQENKKIDFVINITDINQDNLLKLESILASNNITPKFMFVNHYEHGLNSKKNNIITILYGADIFIRQQNQTEYKVDSCILVDGPASKPTDKTYHYFTLNKESGSYADMVLSIDQFNYLSINYDKVVFQYYRKSFPQIFFDAAIKLPTYYDIEDRTLLNNHINKLLGEESYCNSNDLSSGTIQDKIKTKHTCLHRAKSILSQLPCKDYCDELQKIIDNSL